MLPGLKQVTRKILEGPSPSEGARTATYRNIQRSLPIFNGRYAIAESHATPPLVTPVLSTIGPPIVLYHPVFGHFLDDIGDKGLFIPQDVLNATVNLMEISTALYPYEKDRKPLIHAEFCKAISFGCAQIVNLDSTTPDAVALSTIGNPINETVALLIHEDKRELGEGGCDPTIQAALSAARFWSQPNVCIPTHCTFLDCSPNIFLIAHHY